MTGSSSSNFHHQLLATFGWYEFTTTSTSHIVLNRSPLKIWCRRKLSTRLCSVQLLIRDKRIRNCDYNGKINSLSHDYYIEEVHINYKSQKAVCEERKSSVKHSLVTSYISRLHLRARRQSWLQSATLFRQLLKKLRWKRCTNWGHLLILGCTL